MVTSVTILKLYLESTLLPLLSLLLIYIPERMSHHDCVAIMISCIRIAPSPMKSASLICARSAERALLRMQRHAGRMRSFPVRWRDKSDPKGRMKEAISKTLFETRQIDGQNNCWMFCGLERCIGMTLVNQALSTENLIANIGVDTAENESPKVSRK